MGVGEGAGAGQLDSLTLAEPGSPPAKWGPVGNEVKDTQGLLLALLGPHRLPTASPRAPKPGEMGEAASLPLSQPELSELILGRRHILVQENQSQPALLSQQEVQPLLCQLREPLHGHPGSALPAQCGPPPWACPHVPVSC